MKLVDSSQLNLNFKYFHYVAVLFVLSFIISNILAVKIFNVHSVPIPAGMVIFPLSYIFSDILTEVYGFKRARQLIWFTVFCEIAVVLFSRLAIILPVSPYWPHQDAFALVLGPQWRIVLASCTAYLLGDFTNCNIIARLKIKYGRRFIAFRFILSTAVGVLIDNTIFTLLAFTGILPLETMGSLILGQYIIKVSYETIMSPFSVSASNWLKKQEGIDAYNSNTGLGVFNPQKDRTLETTHASHDSLKSL